MNENRNHKRFKGRSPNNSNKDSKVQNYVKCVHCQEAHYLFNCDKFKTLDLEKRYDLVKAKNLCRACLKPNHPVKYCRFKTKCGIENCNQYHNKLLHDPNYQRVKVSHTKSTEEEDEA